MKLVARLHIPHLGAAVAVSRHDPPAITQYLAALHPLSALELAAATQLLEMKLISKNAPSVYVPESFGFQ